MLQRVTAPIQVDKTNAYKCTLWRKGMSSCHSLDSVGRSEHASSIKQSIPKYSRGPRVGVHDCLQLFLLPIKFGLSSLRKSWLALTKNLLKNTKAESTISMHFPGSLPCCHKVTGQVLTRWNYLDSHSLIANIRQPLKRMVPGKVGTNHPPPSARRSLAIEQHLPTFLRDALDPVSAVCFHPSPSQSHEIIMKPYEKYKMY